MARSYRALPLERRVPRFKVLFAAGQCHLEWIEKEAP